MTRLFGAFNLIKVMITGGDSTIVGPLTALCRRDDPVLPYDGSRTAIVSETKVDQKFELVTIGFNSTNNPAIVQLIPGCVWFRRGYLKKIKI